MAESATLEGRIETTVRAVESGTAAELVVVIAGRSARYAEVPWMAGALAAWVALAFLAWSPLVFNGFWFPVDAAVVGGFVGFFAGRSPRAIRALTGPATRQAAVEAAARASFVEEAVQGTRDRTGVLVYISRLEDRVVVLPDEALLGRVPAARWSEITFDGAHDDAIVAGLTRLGERLAAWLPAEGENPDEIPDAPRMRL